MLSFRYTVSHGLREVFPAVQIENRFFFFRCQSSFLFVCVFFFTLPLFCNPQLHQHKLFPHIVKTKQALFNYPNMFKTCWTCCATFPPLVSHN